MTLTKELAYNNAALKCFMVHAPGATFTTLHFLLYFKNGLNNLVCYITLVWKGLSGKNPKP